MMRRRIAASAFICAATTKSFNMSMTQHQFRQQHHDGGSEKQVEQSDDVRAGHLKGSLSYRRQYNTRTPNVSTGKERRLPPARAQAFSQAETLTNKLNSILHTQGATALHTELVAKNYKTSSHLSRLVVCGFVRPSSNHAITDGDADGSCIASAQRFVRDPQNANAEETFLLAEKLSQQQLSGLQAAETTLRSSVAKLLHAVEKLLTMPDRRNHAFLQLQDFVLSGGLSSAMLKKVPQRILEVAGVNPMTLEMSSETTSPVVPSSLFELRVGVSRLSNDRGKYSGKSAGQQGELPKGAPAAARFDSVTLQDYIRTKFLTLTKNELVDETKQSSSLATTTSLFISKKDLAHVEELLLEAELLHKEAEKNNLEAEAEALLFAPDVKQDVAAQQKLKDDLVAKVITLNSSHRRLLESIPVLLPAVQTNWEIAAFVLRDALARRRADTRAALGHRKNQHHVPRPSDGVLYLSFPTVFATFRNLPLDKASLFAPEVTKLGHLPWHIPSLVLAELIGIVNGNNSSCDQQQRRALCEEVLLPLWQQSRTVELQHPEQHLIHPCLPTKSKNLPHPHHFTGLKSVSQMLIARVKEVQQQQSHGAESPANELSKLLQRPVETYRRELTRAIQDLELRSVCIATPRMERVFGFTTTAIAPMLNHTLLSIEKNGLINTAPFWNPKKVLLRFNGVSLRGVHPLAFISELNAILPTATTTQVLKRHVDKKSGGSIDIFGNHLRVYSNGYVDVTAQSSQEAKTFAMLLFKANNQNDLEKRAETLTELASLAVPTAFTTFEEESAVTSNNEMEAIHSSAAEGTVEKSAIELLRQGHWRESINNYGRFLAKKDFYVPSAFSRGPNELAILRPDLTLRMQFALVAHILSGDQRRVAQFRDHDPLYRGFMSTIDALASKRVYSPGGASHSSESQSRNEPPRSNELSGLSQLFSQLGRLISTCNSLSVYGQGGYYATRAALVDMFEPVRSIRNGATTMVHEATFEKMVQTALASATVAPFTLQQEAVEPNEGVDATSSVENGARKAATCISQLKMSLSFSLWIAVASQVGMWDVPFRKLRDVQLASSLARKENNENGKNEEECLHLKIESWAVDALLYGLSMALLENKAATIAKMQRVGLLRPDGDDEVSGVPPPVLLQRRQLSDKASRIVNGSLASALNTVNLQALGDAARHKMIFTSQVSYSTEKDTEKSAAESEECDASLALRDTKKSKSPQSVLLRAVNMTEVVNTITSRGVDAGSSLPQPPAAVLPSLFSFGTSPTEARGVDAPSHLRCIAKEAGVTTFFDEATLRSTSARSSGSVFETMMSQREGGVWSGDREQIVMKEQLVRYVGTQEDAAASEAVANSFWLKRDADMMGAPLPLFSPNDQAGLIQRLDKQTSGLLLGTQGSSSYEKMRRGAQEGSGVEKTYLAIVCRRPPHRGPAGELVEFPLLEQHDGVINIPLPKNRGVNASSTRQQSKSTSAISSATTVFSVVKRFRFKDVALVRVKIRNGGRMHQIRRHFAHIGYPLVGDVQYGFDPRPLMFVRKGALPKNTFTDPTANLKAAAAVFNGCGDHSNDNEATLDTMKSNRFALHACTVAATSASAMGTAAKAKQLHHASIPQDMQALIKALLEEDAAVSALLKKRREERMAQRNSSESAKDDGGDDDGDDGSEVLDAAELQFAA